MLEWIIGTVRQAIMMVIGVWIGVSVAMWLLN
jgi:hypothetical protein